MKIKRLSTLEGAKKAEGISVIIDVFRAFTTSAFIISNGANRIYTVSEVDEALNLRDRNPDWILIGERNGIRIKGFDHGNSPHEVSRIDFEGKNVILTTSAGTKGLLAAINSIEVLPGSFVIADNIIKYIKIRKPEILSLVAMGLNGVNSSIGDEYLADYIEQSLLGKNPNFRFMKKKIRADPEGAKFFDTSKPNFIPEDFHYSMDLNRFNFCLKLIQDNPPYIIRINPNQTNSFKEK